MCTAPKSLQTSAFSSATALEAELGKDGLHYKDMEDVSPTNANDLFKTKMEGFNESITESQHRTVIMGCIKVWHQLHIAV